MGSEQVKPWLPGIKNVGPSDVNLGEKKQVIPYYGVTIIE
jgi:hypothetical protein